MDTLLFFLVGLMVIMSVFALPPIIEDARNRRNK